MSRQDEFNAGQGRVRQFPAGDPELEAYEGQKATLIEGPRRWRGTLAKHWQTGTLGLNIGAKTRRPINDWRGHVVEVGEDSELHFKHWKTHATARPPGPDCPKCRAENP